MVAGAVRDRPLSSEAPVLQTVGLTKTYGKLVALDQLNLEVQGGRVYGFLGPNGAGKTTTIDLVLKLITPTAGHVEMLGLDMRTDGAETLRRSGAVPEGQAYFPLLSARDNLKIWGAISGETSEKRRDEVLDLVSLLPRAKDKVRTYSQGMKQRLGLAAALLHDPELLILDEPTNGLDPAGIREFRQLFRDLAARGKTVFVSSHLLNEVELMCDEVAILQQGKLITQGDVRQLLRGGDALEIEVTDGDRAEQALRSLDWLGDVQRNGNRFVVGAPRERAHEISRALAEHQVYLAELRPRESTLEEFFLEVTGEPATE
jgi:ABC-2 type transport system ATP-binding protein